MRRGVFMACLAATATAWLLHAQQKPKALTDLDYIEIKQLLAKYAFALDTCSNKGEDYANLYVEDGVFSSSTGSLLVRGHEALAKLAQGCREQPLTHVPHNIVIEPTAEGARGYTYVVYPGDQGSKASGHLGGYQDTYVKTDKGWRFKTRTHILPPDIPGQWKGDPYNPPKAPDAKGKAKAK